MSPHPRVPTQVRRSARTFANATLAAQWSIYRYTPLDPTDDSYQFYVFP
jgi:hypothetical protein